MKLKKVQKTRFRKKKASSQQEAISSSNHEIKGLIIVAIGILIWISFSFKNSTGSFGKFITTTLLGFMGFPAFIIPYMLIFLGISLMIKKTNDILRSKASHIVLLIVIISAMFHTASFKFVDLDKASLLGCIDDFFVRGTKMQGGGIVGGLVSIPFIKVFQPLGTILILTTVAIIDVIVITEVSVVEFIRKMLKIAFLTLRHIVLFVSSLFVRNKAVISQTKDYQIAVPQSIKNEKEPEIIYNIKSLEDELSSDNGNIPLDGKSEIGFLKNILMFINRKQVSKAKAENISVKSEKIDRINKSNKLEKDKPVEIIIPQRDGKPTKSKENTKPIDEKEIVELAEILKKNKTKAPNDTYQYIREGYKLPDNTLLTKAENVGISRDKIIAQAKENLKKLEDTLASFGVDAKVVNITVGPAVTRYELTPNPGVKVSKIVSLSDDIALTLASSGIRIEAPIPGKSAIGVEVPNKETSAVLLSEVIATPEFASFPSKVAFAVGKDISGENIIADISKMPHLLIAGATGSGKSVCINSLIVSLLYKSNPDEVKLLMIDPKVVELGVYNGIPHLLIPVVTDPKKAAGALNWAVVEMTNRYKLFAEKGVRDIFGYNKLMINSNGETFPQIVIIIDELADLMMVAPNDVEDAICRLAQMARAAGMHLVVATQRPSVDVITGIIKANIPSRISFAVSSQVDSRTILDMGGAEKLLGKGDMLFYPVGEAKPIRVKGCFITEKEVENVVDFVKQQKNAQYNDNIMEQIKASNVGNKNISDGDEDDLLMLAIELVVDAGQASASLLQRKFKVGYARAARMIDQMEQQRVVGPFDGAKPRHVLISKQQFMEMYASKRG